MMPIESRYFRFALLVTGIVALGGLFKWLLLIRVIGLEINVPHVINLISALSAAFAAFFAWKTLKEQRWSGRPYLDISELTTITNPDPPNGQQIVVNFRLTNRGTRRANNVKLVVSVYDEDLSLMGGHADVVGFAEISGRETPVVGPIFIRWQHPEKPLYIVVLVAYTDRSVRKRFTTVLRRKGRPGQDLPHQNHLFLTPAEDEMLLKKVGVGSN